MPPYRPLEDRFWEKVAIPADVMGGCWLWTAALRDLGYGAIGLEAPDTKIGKSHRVAWELVNGPIPHGLHVCHKCDVRFRDRPKSQ